MSPTANIKKIKQLFPEIKRGDIVHIGVDPEDRNTGKHVWTGEHLDDLDYDKPVLLRS